MGKTFFFYSFLLIKHLRKVINILKNKQLYNDKSSPFIASKHYLEGMKIPGASKLPQLFKENESSNYANHQLYDKAINNYMDIHNSANNITISRNKRATNVSDQLLNDYRVYSGIPVTKKPKSPNDTITYHTLFDTVRDYDMFSADNIRKYPAFNPEINRGSEKVLLNRNKRQVEEEKENEMYDRIVKNNQKEALKLLTSSLDREKMMARSDRYYLVGYDCDKPIKAPIATSSFIHTHCDTELPDEEVKSVAKEQNYQIIYKEDEKEIEGHRCTVHKTKRVVQCGFSDWATNYSPANMYNEPVSLHTAECQALVRDRIYIANNQIYNIKIGEPLRVSYYEAGSESFSSSNHINCEGGTTYINGIQRSSMIVHIILRISVTKEVIMRRQDNSLVALVGNIRLPCDESAYACIAGVSTYIWAKSAKPYCPGVVSRTVRGQIVRTSVDSMLLSTDASGVRLSLGPPTILCNREVLTTSHPEIFVFKLNSENGKPKPDKFDRPVDDTRHVHMYLHLTIREDTLYAEVTEELRKEFRRSRVDECILRSRVSKLEHFMARKFPSFDTYNMGLGSVFLTTAHEMIYRYHCNSKIVQAINARHCYDKLPVVVLDKPNNSTNFNFSVIDRSPGSSKLHFEDFAKDHNSNPKYLKQPEYFIEPLTHKITRFATIKPCTEGLFGGFVDIFGRWFQVTPNLYSMEREPQTIKLTDLARIDYVQHVSPIERSSRGRGIYTDESLKKMSQHLMFPGVKTALLNKITQQAAHTQPGEYITPNTIFPSYVLPGGSWQTFILGHFWAWLKKMGDATAAILFLYYLIKWCVFIWQVAHSFCHFYEKYGLSVLLCYSFCASQHHSKEVRDTHRKTKNESEYLTHIETMRDEISTVKLSSYNENMRKLIPEREYNIIPRKFNRQDIIIGSLQYAYDKYYGRTPTIRDEFLAKLASAPAIINDIAIKKGDSFYQIYPELDPIPTPIYTNPPQDQTIPTYSQINKNSTFNNVDLN